MIQTYSADAFRDFYAKTPQTNYEFDHGIVWFEPANGMERCIDRVSLENNRNGGSDDVHLVMAPSRPEARAELERIRPR